MRRERDRDATRGNVTPESVARRSEGFTLVELLVVIGIIIVALGFMLPALTESIRTRKIGDVGDLIVSKCNEARSNAVAQKRPWAVIFLRDGLQLFKGRKGDGLDDNAGALVGEITPYEPAREPGEATDVRLSLRFAVDALATMVDEDGNEGEVPRYAVRPDEDQVLADTENVYLQFLPDGTVDFGRFSDISTSAWQDEVDADIIVTQLGNSLNQGLIDVSLVTGRPTFKITEIREEEL